MRKYQNWWIRGNWASDASPWCDEIILVWTILIWQLKQTKNIRYIIAKVGWPLKKEGFGTARPHITSFSRDATECDLMRQLYTLFLFAESNPPALHSGGTWPRTRHVTTRLMGSTERNNQVRQTVPHLCLPVFLFCFCSSKQPRLDQPWDVGEGLGRTWRGLGEGDVWIRPDPFSFQHELKEGWKKRYSISELN